MATHSSVLAWRIPGTGEPGGLPSMRSHRVRHDWRDLAAAAAATWGGGGLVFQTNSKDSAWTWQFLKWKREKNFRESSRQEVKLYVNFHWVQTGWLLMTFLPFISFTWYACKIAEGTGGGGGCSCCCLVTKSCSTLCDPMDYSSSGSSAHGISQSRILKWAAVSFSRGSFQELVILYLIFHSYFF